MDFKSFVKLGGVLTDAAAPLLGPAATGSLEALQGTRLRL